MESIYMLIPIALVLVIVGIAIFFWAVNSGQYDDLEGPAHSILFDDEPTVNKNTDENSSSETNENAESNDSAKQ